MWMRLQAKESRVGRQYKGRRKAPQQDSTFYQELRSSDDMDMALVVRAARNLPIRLLAGEYERILKRRLAAVGGSPDDAALAEMVTCFRCRALSLPFSHVVFGSKQSQTIERGGAEHLAALRTHGIQKVRKDWRSRDLLSRIPSL